MRISELCALKWENVQDGDEPTITIEERDCRGDWDIPKSEASRATISVNGCVIDRLQRLKGLTIKVKAGFGTRIYEASKDTPEGLIFLLGARRKADEG